VTATDTPAVTPTVRQWFRSTRFWIVLVVGVLLVSTVWTLATAGIRNTDPLASDNPGPAGGMALAEVLRQQGVTVTAAGTFAEAQAASTDPADTTILLFDQGFFLEPERIARLRDLADHLVVVAPTSELLDEYAPDVAFAGFPDAEDPLAPACDLPAATRAGPIVAGQSALQPADDTASGVVFCYPDTASGYLLAQTDAAGPTVTLLPDAEPFDNQHVTSAGNAALALNLLGGTDTLVWYIPGLLDVSGSGAEPTIADLTPDWVTPVLTLLLAVFLAAAIWRGRRLGPLVVENLPVVVPSRETMEGRARLYQRSSARRRALDALRVGALGRIATALALSRTTSVEDVVHAAAAATGRSADEVRNVLLDAVPESDAALVQLSDALTQLERDIRTATDPRTPPGRMDR
jgi:hypothetical protein